MMELCCHRFTAVEGGTRLAAAAKAANTLVTECGAFVATRLTHEEAYNIRGLLSSGRQRSIHISRAASVKPDAYELSILTDLKVAQAVAYDDVLDWSQELETREVVVCTSTVLRQILERGLLEMSQINILVIGSCHTIYKDEHLQYIMKVYKQSEELKRPRILAVTYPMFYSPKVEDSFKTENPDGTDDQDNETEPHPTIDNALVPLKNQESFDVASGKLAIEHGRIEHPTIETLRELGVHENLDDFDMYEKLEFKIDQLEKELCCNMDLAEDIDGCKRISGSTTKPKEVLIEYSLKAPDTEISKDYIDLENFMRESVAEVLTFLEDHRHDPTEIYGEELYDEFKNIPNPTIEPRQMIKEFLYILGQLGPYAADRAAFAQLVKLEKLKIKVPYERHFLLLRLCTTSFVKIRCYADTILSQYDDWDKVRLFSTPKLMRLVEILEKFTPPDLKASIDNGTYVKVEPKHYYDNNYVIHEDEKKVIEEKSKEIHYKVIEEKSKEIHYIDKNNIKLNTNDDGKNNQFNDVDEDGNEASPCNTNDLETGRQKERMLSAIDKCDFTTLGNRIEDRLNVIQGNLKDLDVQERTEERKNDFYQINQSLLMKTQARIEKAVFSRRSGRVRGRRPPRNNARQSQAHNPDALCGIVFVKEAFMAKILFMCIVEISRLRPAVSYINSQYCAVEPIAEHKESEMQGRRHEEVLKKFRMHECNLLLTTSAFEEGIDLPRCNLVLRWDLPPSYRSYVLCRGRSRAARGAAVALGASAHTDHIMHCLATYKELDQIITRKCGCGIQDEPPSDEEDHADTFNSVIEPYTPATAPCLCSKNRIKNDIVKSMKRTISDSENVNSETCEYNIHDLKHMKLSDDNVSEISDSSVKGSDKCSCSANSDRESVASVDLNSAIALINKYCAKLPSDTFTRLAPQWWMERVQLSDEPRDAYICTLRLPLNCPVKYNIVGHPMPTRVLARRIVALQACRILHKSGELDNQLMPIGKENFQAMELDNAHPVQDTLLTQNDSARPGTTKRRQYYYKRTAWAFTDCQPVIDSSDTDLEKHVSIGEKTEAVKQGSNSDSDHKQKTVNDTGELLVPNKLEPKLEGTEAVTQGSNENSDDDHKQKTVKDTGELFSINKLESKRNKTEAVKQGSNENLDSDHKQKTEEKTVKDTGGRRNMLYAIESSLWCALPERYNTRGRRLHAPQHANQALAILMARNEPTNLQIPAFPVYTRSGEVRISVEHVPDADVRMSPRRGRLVRRFMQFVFTEVLRVRRRGMSLENEGTTRNNYYIVPTIKSIRENGTHKIDIDWAFLEKIYTYTEQQNLMDAPIYPHKTSEGDSSVPLKNPLLKDGEVFVFDAEHYKDAVVTPWYRNQDQPQFFLVAEICVHLTPDSAFPSPIHKTFRSYYRSKYKVELTQPHQPLLDVDHTSARLNLLTPRYVNRKGVALPVSSERTRRAKRDRLDQKQILVPELCTVHPFAAPLWFATVALPCILYRINALLIADEIRRAVAIDVGLGVPKIDDRTMPGFQWPALDFGWCLAEVLSADEEKTHKTKEDDIDNDETFKEIGATEEQNSEVSVKMDEDEGLDELREKTLNEILQAEHEKLNQEDNESGFEIGTWTNDMASSIPDEVDDIYDEWSEPLPPNLTFCTSANGGVNWCEPVQKAKPEYTMADSDCSYTSSDFDSDDSDFDQETDTENESGFGSNKAVNASLGVRIEYKTAHEAEAVDLETPKKTHPSPQRDPGDEKVDRAELLELLKSGVADEKYIENFHSAVRAHKQTIISSGLVTKDNKLCELVPETRDSTEKLKMVATEQKIKDIFPYRSDQLQLVDGKICIESIERNKRVLLKELKVSLSDEEIAKLNCFYMRDINIDEPGYVNDKIANVGFDSKEKYIKKVQNYERKDYKPYYADRKGQSGEEFDFDYQPDLDGHPGPSPSVILQALTMSNANDGINLERLETIGDSFLKFAITAYLYCAHPTVHEGKLSHMRSKQVSNLNLYRLGRSARLGSRMIASKFEPHDNWLPPCHRAPPSPHEQHQKLMQESQNAETKKVPEVTGCYIPYNLITQHSIPDKSIADCVEALIGAYLLECGPRGALLFMAWLGISVLPHHRIALPQNNLKDDTRPSPSKLQRTAASSSSSDENCDESEVETPDSSEPWGSGGFGPAGARRPYVDEQGNWYQIVYGELKAPPSPLLRYIQDPEGELELMLSGYDALENTLQYRFNDRSLLLQAMTHASHQRNTLTDCYQRLEFLGDAILDYLITRHLYEDPRRHSPGALTDLRSALVNNTIFATLAVRHGFHKYFRHMSPGLNEVLMKYVRIQEENGHSISEEHYLIQEDELEQAEDVEVPKALGDLFESIAGAIFLDSGMSLGAVWGSYVRLMGAELEAFSAAAPKSPVRELLEAEPDTAKFSKPERLADGRRVRVCVEVFGRGIFKGVGRNYRIAKGTAARCALRHLRKYRR